MDVNRQNKGDADSTAAGIGKELLETMDGDRDEARRLADMFFEQAEKQIGDIEIATEARDRESLAAAAHKCAGGAAACGLYGLSDSLRAIENRASEADWSDLERETQTLPETLRATREEMELFFAENGDAQ